MNRIFVRHGILSDSRAMATLERRLCALPDVEDVDNRDYLWKNPVVETGPELARQVLATAESGDDVLLVGHSQGGLVCRMAAIALKGTRRGTAGQPIREIQDWQKEQRERRGQVGNVGVVTIGTPNCGALTLGQMSVITELVARAALPLADYAGLYNLKYLTTPQLFRELEHWSVNANYLTVSGVRVNRFRKGLWDRAADITPADKFAVRLEKPNDGIVEDSSTDLRQSLIRPEVDLERCYRHRRAYRNSIELGHCDLQASEDVFEVIERNFSWLLRKEQTSTGTTPPSDAPR